MPQAWRSNVRDDVIGGLVSAAIAIPLAMGYGMFDLWATNILPTAHWLASTLYSSLQSPVSSWAIERRRYTRRGSRARFSSARFYTAWSTPRRPYRAPAQH